MSRRTVDLRIAGQNYRVVSSADEEELRRLAGVVEAKVAEVSGRGRGPVGQSVLLAAIALAHEVEAERAKRSQLERRAKDMLRRVLQRIDDVLGGESGAESGSERTAEDAAGQREQGQRFT